MQPEIESVAPEWRTRLLQFARAVRRIVGAPDYAAYVEHCNRAGHAVTVSEKEYVRQFFEAKRTGVRCC